MTWPTCPPTIHAVLAVPIAAEPLTLDEGKLRAGLDWIVGDPRDPLMLEFISAARQQVEQDTGIAVPVQLRDLFLDTLPIIIAWQDLPPQTMPLRNVESVTAIDSSGAATVLPPADYVATISNAGVTLSIVNPPADAQRWIVRVEAGFDVIPPSLLQAVGLLTAHYATIGRDLTITGTIVAVTPLGYEEAIRPFVRMALI
jgi:uncharacterized phiE125 gp8 family phage protein